MSHIVRVRLQVLNRAVVRGGGTGGGWCSVLWLDAWSEGAVAKLQAAWLWVLNAWWGGELR